MTTISLVATDQLLSVALQPKVASGDQNTVKLHVDFDSEWDRFAKSAVFFTSENKTVYEVLMTSNNCLIPHEVLKKSGTLYIGVRGVNADNNEVKTSSLVKYKIAEGAPAGDGTTVEPTADVYQQLLTAITVLGARCDVFMAHPDGNTNADAELTDIRVGFNGEQHETAGTAVREQVGMVYRYAENIQAEIENARIGVNEEVYGTLGDAIREQIAMAHGDALSVDAEVRDACRDSDGKIYDSLGDRITALEMRGQNTILPATLDG